MATEKLSIIDILTNKFYRDFVSAEDQKFFDFVFSKNPSQKMLDELLKIWDIEVKSAKQALLLSYLMKDYPELQFGDGMASRLEKLLEFYKCKNAELLEYFSHVGKALNSKGIEPMIFKGAAMKVLRPELSRSMGDVDFLVRPREFDKTIEITEQCGFHGIRASHSVDMKTVDNEWALDIHSFFKVDDLEGKNAFKYAEKLNAGFYKRAKKIKAFDIDCLMPCHEDLFFIVLTNLSKNMTVRTSVDNILFALFDLKFLMTKENFDWEIVFENIKISGSQEKVRIAAEFIERIVSGFLPQTLHENIPFKGKVRNYYERVYYDQYHYLDFRQECHGFLLADALKKRQLLKYVVMRLKYQLMRLIRKRPVLIHLYLRGKNAASK